MHGRSSACAILCCMNDPCATRFLRHPIRRRLRLRVVWLSLT